MVNQMNYENLILQTKIWNKLKTYFEKNKLPNAFLFYGDDGIGKEAHAIEFATLINCESLTDLISCGKCGSCKKMKLLQWQHIIHGYPLSCYVYFN